MAELADHGQKGRVTQAATSCLVIGLQVAIPWALAFLKKAEDSLADADTQGRGDVPEYRRQLALQGIESFCS